MTFAVMAVSAKAVALVAVTFAIGKLNASRAAARIGLSAVFRRTRLIAWLGRPSPLGTTPTDSSPTDCTTS